LQDLATGRFQRVIPDERPAASYETTKRVLICTGKIYYDLIDLREKQKRNDIAIIRMEQLYPLPNVQLRAAMDSFAAGTRVYWVQEEPENMGAWRYIRVE